MEKKWFRRKLYGFGWYPVSWEGWVVILVWVGILVFSVAKFDHELQKNLIVVFVMTVILIYICYKKGEKPKWQWGKRIED